MFTIAIIFIVIVCIFLILIVLVQNSKGGGLAAGFNSGSSNLMGVKRTNDLLENITWGLAITLLVSCLATNFILDKNGNSQEEGINSVNIERAQESGFAPQPQQQQQAEPQK